MSEGNLAEGVAGFLAEARKEQPPKPATSAPPVRRPRRRPEPLTDLERRRLLREGWPEESIDLLERFGRTEMLYPLLRVEGEQYEGLRRRSRLRAAELPETSPKNSSTPTAGSGRP